MQKNYKLSAALLFALAASAAPALALGGTETHFITPGSHEHAGYLGVGLHDVTAETAPQLKLKESRGAEVVAVDRDGPSGKSLQEHDVILELNGQRVDSGDDIRRILRDTPPGHKAALALSRDGKPVQVEIVLGDRMASAHVSLPNLNIQMPDMASMADLGPGLASVESLGNLGDVDMEVMLHGALAGAVVESVGPQLAHYFGAKDGTGVLVREVRENTPAAAGGMKAGDFIIRAAGQPIPSRVEWDRRLRENRGKSLHVEVLRDHREQKLTILLPAQTSGELMLPQVDTEKVNAQLASLREQIDATTREQVNRAVASVSDAEAEKALATVREQMQSPEFQQELDTAKEKSQEFMKQYGPELQRQLDQAQQEAQRAVEQHQPDIDKAMQDAERALQDALQSLDMQ